MAEWFRALDLKSGGPWFKSSTLPLSGFLTVYVIFEIPVYLFTVSSISTAVLNTFDTY